MAVSDDCTAGAEAVEERQAPHSVILMHWALVLPPLPIHEKPSSEMERVFLCELVLRWHGLGMAVPGSCTAWDLQDWKLKGDCHLFTTFDGK